MNRYYDLVYNTGEAIKELMVSYEVKDIEFIPKSIDFENNKIKFDLANLKTNKTYDYEMELRQFIALRRWLL